MARTEPGQTGPWTTRVRDQAREAAAGPYRRQWPAVLDGLRRLAQLRAQPVPADLATWAVDLADVTDPAAAVESGPGRAADEPGESGWGVPLLGTSLTAQPFPALLWNGARSARAGLG
ncbi:MAG: hypothetical protein M3400_02890, partial [Actinomycetota bacterium]|nr:hypothetical protein [Actinomycetota bacterium]